MKATFALLPNFEIHNAVRKLSWDVNRIVQQLKWRHHVTPLKFPEDWQSLAVSNVVLAVKNCCNPLMYQFGLVEAVEM